MKSFTHLHNHTHYSLKDAISSSAQLAEFAAKSGQPALAITDHGNLIGAIEHYKACKSYNIKPILGCLISGQPIITIDGIKNVEDIKIGDLVLTHKGRFKSVISTMKRTHKGKFIEITLNQKYPNSVIVTDEHPIYISDSEGNAKFIRADEIKAGQKNKHGGINNWNSYVVFPKINNCLELKLNLETILPKDFSFNEKNNRWEKVITNNVIAYWNIPKEIVLDEKLAYLIGIFCCEGSFSTNRNKKISGQIIFSLHSNEVEIANKITKYLKELFNLECSIKNRMPNRNSLEVYTCSIPIAYLFKYLCGKGAKNKKASKEIFLVNQQIQSAFIQGIKDGDCKKLTTNSNNKQQTLKVISKNLAWQFKTLLANQGSFTSVKYTKSKEKSRQDTYLVSYTDITNTKFKHSKEFNNFVIKPIKKIRSFIDTKDVYNFEVEEDNSYVSDFAMHNCEIYLATKSARSSNRTDGNKTTHLTVFASTNEGWTNLIKIISDAHINGMGSGKPRVDKNFLKAHSKGLIALSGCQSSQISRAILEDNIVGAKASIEELQGIFGKDNFFLEIMRINNPRQTKIEEALLQLHKETNIPIVATNDIHWMCKGDYDVHDTMISIQGEELKYSMDRKFKYDTKELYFKNSNEMRSIFSDIEEACDNTLLISDMCNVELELNKIRFPQWNDSEGLTALERFNKEVLNGFKTRYSDNNIAAKNRLEHELKVIIKLGFHEYFLILWDIFNFCRKSNIPTGPGRGSAAGSLVVYCLGITNVDPLKYNLIFERFLNESRVSPPDIDSDICQVRRDEVIEYLKHKYGQDSIAKIGTLMKIYPRTAIREIGKRLETPFEFLAKVEKRVPEGPNVSFKELLKIDPELQELQKENPAFFKNAIGLEGKPIHTGSHAAGIIISDQPLSNLIPLSKDKGTDGLVTQYQMNDLEAVGLLKVDLLGLKTLSIINRCIEFIGTDRAEIERKLNAVDDINVYNNIFRKGDTLGIFQFESAGMINYLIDLEPSTIDDISAMNALYRPGPITSKLVEKFINRKHGTERVDFKDKRLENILKDTYGLMIMQEDCMNISTVLAGFSPVESDNLRRAIGKKDLKKMQDIKSQFINGCINNNVPEKIANEIFQEMEAFADYGFCKSHSISYAILAYKCAWLKNYHLIEFIAANLDFEENNDGKLQTFLHYAESKNIKILPPHINLSGVKSSIENGNIRLGLAHIKGISENIAKQIIKNKPKLGYKSMADIVRVLENEK